MAFTPPNVFVPGTVVNSAEVQGNSDALRVYLHGGVIGADLLASRWADTRHVQSPQVDAYLGLQHGVTGWQGGQDSGGPLVRASFTTSYMTGGKYGAIEWIPVPQTALRLSIRRPMQVMFHYRWELIAGPDNAPNDAPRIPNDDERLVTVTPYVGSLDFPAVASAQDTVNNHRGWGGSSTFSPSAPYNIVGWGAKSGTILRSYNGVGTTTFGLASYSEVDRVAFLNWAVVVEGWYL